MAEWFAAMSSRPAYQKVRLLYLLWCWITYCVADVCQFIFHRKDCCIGFPRQESMLVIGYRVLPCSGAYHI